jgi:DNA-binding LytR/AlgR family response regulator
MTTVKKSKILIVEDEMIIAADLSLQLTKLGYQVIGIQTHGEDALKTVDQNRPDIVIMDIVLSGEMNGIQAAQIIHDKYNIPIIYLTSNADDATFQKAKATKPYAFISKPFRREDLSRAIELTIERTEMEKSETGQTDQVSTLEDRLFIRHKDHMVMVPIEDIMVLEADRNYCKVVSKDQEFFVSLPMGKIEQLLPSEDFIRVHRSFIVNLKQITSINDHYEYLMIGKRNVPISRRMKDDVVKRMKLI